MLGSIIGDYIGSRYEFENHRSKDFPLFNDSCFFTDDTILTVATMDALLNKMPYEVCYKYWGNKYSKNSTFSNKQRKYKSGFGQSFHAWLLNKDNNPYNSYGNGSAMRVAPVAYAYSLSCPIETIHIEAAKSAAVTHNHSEGIYGAQATAGMVYNALQTSIAEMGDFNTSMCKFLDLCYINGYTDHYRGVETPYRGSLLGDDLEVISKTYKFDVTCQGTVPLAFNCFVNSTSFEDAIRNAVMVGGDTDTLCAIVGGIAEAFYGIPNAIKSPILNQLSLEMRLIVDEFYDVFVTQKQKIDTLDSNGFYIK